MNGSPRAMLQDKRIEKIKKSDINKNTNILSYLTWKTTIDVEILHDLPGNCWRMAARLLPRGDGDVGAVLLLWPVDHPKTLKDKWWSQI